jgi:hypothetical protein
MALTDARPGGAGTSSHSSRLARTIVSAAARWVADVPPRTLLVSLACVQWLLVAVTARAVGHAGSIAIVVPQVVVLLPLALVLVYGIARRLGGRLFAAWAAAVWIVLPYAGLVYANPSLRHDYAHRFLPHLLGLADDPKFPAMVAFLAAMLFALRAVEGARNIDAAIAVAAAAVGSAFVPREALVALAPLVALALGGKIRHAILAAAALAILLAGVAGAVAADLLSAPFAHVGIQAPADTLTSLSENFWSGRVLEWLAIAGVVGAIRGRRAAGAMLGIAMLAAFVSLKGVPSSLPTPLVPLARNVSLLQALLPAWPAFTLAVASLPLLVPRRKLGGEHGSPPPAQGARSS